MRAQSPQSYDTPSRTEVFAKMAGHGDGSIPTPSAPRKLFTVDQMTELVNELSMGGLTVSPSPALGSRAPVVGFQGPPSPQKEFRFPKHVPYFIDPDGLDVFVPAVA
jgi:hypothetical protein